MQRIIRYSSRRTLVFFALADLLLPLLTLFVVHYFFGDMPWKETCPLPLK